MTTGITSSFTGDLVLRALDAAALRHGVLAANVANAANGWYRPLRVNFDEQLAAARSELLRRDDEAASRRTLARLRPEIAPDPSYVLAGQDQVRLDAEIGKMMQNAVHYQSLLTALSKNGSMLRIAIREGRS